MIGEVILGLLCAIAVFILAICAFNFFVEIPTQLKRIADALEKEQKAGDSK